MLDLELLLTELDDQVYRFLEVGGRTQAAAVVAFRDTVIAGGELGWLDLEEAVAEEVYGSAARRAAKEGRSEEEEVEVEIAKAGERIGELKLLVCGLAEAAGACPGSKHKGLGHWRAVRAEVKELGDMVAQVEAHQGRCREEARRVEKVLAGAERAAGVGEGEGEGEEEEGRDNGADNGKEEEKREGTNDEEGEEETEEKTTAEILLAAHLRRVQVPAPDGLWSIILRLVFGIRSAAQETVKEEEEEEAEVGAAFIL